jgi:CRP-like cAMP-binding protein
VTAGRPHEPSTPKLVSELPCPCCPRREAKTAIAAAVKKLPKTTDQIVRIETAIAGNILFKDLGQGQKNALYEAMWEETVGPGESEVIIKQGDEDADNFYIIDSGTVDIVVDGANVAQLDAGKSFGELALMYFAPRAATCKAATEVTLWVMDRMTFRSFVLGDGEEERKRRKEFLGTVDLLKPLEEEERGKVADAMVEKKFADGEEIMTQGDEGDALYFLEKGEATVIKDGEKVFQYTEVGQFFGELALMNNAPRAATVEASGEVVCLRLGRAEFERLVGSCQEVLQRQAMKYLKMAPVAAAEGPAAAPGAVFDMDDAPEAASPSAAAGAAGGFGGGGDLESENARLRQENNALRAKNAELEAKIMALQAGGGVAEGIPYGGSGGLSTSSIAKKVEESRRARERLAALLNLEDN